MQSIDLRDAAERLLSLDEALATLPEQERQAAYAKQIMERWPLINALLPECDGSERRRSARAPAPVQLRIRCRGVEAIYQAVDISSGGLCIDGAPSDWEVGDPIELVGVVDADVPFESLSTEVSWVVTLKNGASNTCRAGLRVTTAGSLHTNRLRALRSLAFNVHLSKIATGAEV